MRSPRLAVAALGVLALSACATGGTTTSPSAASASASSAAHTLKTVSGTVALRLRHVPQVNGIELAKFPDGTSIIVDCQVKGATVAGTQGSTDVWDRLSYQGHIGFVSAAYVEGGAASSIPTCPYSAAIATSPAT